MEYFFPGTIPIDGNIDALDKQGLKVKHKPFSFIFVYVKI
jgi:hypothetical protein